MRIYKRIFKDNNKKSIMEGAGSGVTITLKDALSSEGELLFKNGVFKVKKQKMSSCDNVTLSSYMWYKEVSGKPLFLLGDVASLINQPEYSFDIKKMESILMDAFNTDEIELKDFNGINKYNDVIDISAFLDDICTPTLLQSNLSIEKISYEIALGDNISFMQGGGYTHGPLPIDILGNFETFISLIIKFKEYSTPVMFETESLFEAEMSLDTTKYMRDAWQWCWNNWSHVTEDETDDEKAISPETWDDMYN
jgi:hypothetical protein